MITSGMALAAAAALLAGPSIMYPPEPRPAKRKRRRVQADRSKKQYLLKGVRP
jgi:hypothetical protein